VRFNSLLANVSFFFVSTISSRTDIHNGFIDDSDLFYANGFLLFLFILLFVIFFALIFLFFIFASTSFKSKQRTPTNETRIQVQWNGTNKFRQQYLNF
jgi:ABC-type phosphate transport system permease subunit